MLSRLTYFLCASTGADFTFAFAWVKWRRWQYPRYPRFLSRGRAGLFGTALAGLPPSAGLRPLLRPRPPTDPSHAASGNLCTIGYSAVRQRLRRAPASYRAAVLDLELCTNARVAYLAAFPAISIKLAFQSPVLITARVFTCSKRTVRVFPRVLSSSRFLTGEREDVTQRSRIQSITHQFIAFASSSLSEKIMSVSPVHRILVIGPSSGFNPPVGSTTNPRAPSMNSASAKARQPKIRSPRRVECVGLGDRRADEQMPQKLLTTT